MSGWSLLCLAGLLSLTTGCERLSSFDLEPGESYCGQITLGSQYRTGFSPRVQMRMTFDADKVEIGKSPGILTTHDAGAEVGEQKLLDGANLRPVPPLSHDALSDLDLGDGRELNFIYAVSPRAPEADSMLAFVTLRSDDAVEVRLLRAGADESDGPADRERRQLFGLFVLRRQKGNCGF